MGMMIMGNLDGNLDRIAFDAGDIKRIVAGHKARLVSSGNGKGLLLELEGEVFPVMEPTDGDDLKPYFILLESGSALNVKDYQVLFDVKGLPGHLLSGKDVGGREHLCRRYGAEADTPSEKKEMTLDRIDERIQEGGVSQGELGALKRMIQNLKDGPFFEALTVEFSGRIKEIAQELIDFRRDIQKRIEPGIVEVASRDIPEASNQLEGINETLEMNTMKIMDINEEQMEIAQRQGQALQAFLSGDGHGGEIPKKALRIMEEEMGSMKRIGELSLMMMEPLSFQDLVGQRIQKIIHLVKSIEVRIEDLVISFGIKVQKHREDPRKSFEDLKKDVEQYKCELKGPQRSGEGLKQSEIDDLLATL